MERHVFIPTKGRYSDIGKLCDVWLNKAFAVHLVVEPHEADRYAINSPSEVEKLVMDRGNAGVAYARAYAVGRAHYRGLKSIILADDDIKPSTRRPDGMGEILEACEHPKIMGMTARYSYHDLCLGPEIKYMDDIILLPTGTFRLVGLNVDNVMNVLGNYDDTLEYAEDCDLFLRSLQAGFPWMVHLGSFSNSMGTRYQPGGMLDYAGGEDKLAEKKAEWHQVIHEQYPDLTNPHTEKCAGKQNCIRISWQRAYDKCLPKWREWSELHGGDLQRYIDGES